MVSSDRPRGMLTASDRQYLQGKSDVEPGSQQERNIRARIRKRVANGFLDCKVLASNLEKRDRRQIADNIHEQIMRGGEAPTDDEAPVDKQDNLDYLGFQTPPPSSYKEAHQALGPVIALTYRLANETGMDFKIPLEVGVKMVEMGYGHFSPTRAGVARVNVEFDIDFTHLPNLRRAKTRFDEGEELTDRELGALIRNERIDMNELHEYLENQSG